MTLEERACLLARDIANAVYRQNPDVEGLGISMIAEPMILSEFVRVRSESPSEPPIVTEPSAAGTEWWGW